MKRQQDPGLEKIFNSHDRKTPQEYRRRRLIAGIALAGTVALAALSVNSITNNAEEQPDVTHTYVVKPGDTMYGIAGDMTPDTGENSRMLDDLIYGDIAELNPGLKPGDIYPGDIIVLPGEAPLPEVSQASDPANNG